jgi:hypothetical protein
LSTKSVIAVRTLDVRIRPLLEAWKKDKTIATTTNHQPIARRFERLLDLIDDCLEGRRVELRDDFLWRAFRRESASSPLSYRSIVPHAANESIGVRQNSGFPK